MVAGRRAVRRRLRYLAGRDRADLGGHRRPGRSIHSPPGLDDDWHHVVFTRVRSTGALALYVDGVAVATGVGGRGSLTAPPVLRLGALQTGATWLRGSLDEAALY